MSEQKYHWYLIGYTFNDASHNGNTRSFNIQLPLESFLPPVSKTKLNELNAIGAEWIKKSDPSTQPVNLFAMSICYLGEMTQTQFNA
ncbi:hypothetical protein KTH73_01600 [Acinetobacter courvalinii]|jgi:hypothetical protein|uniref:Uncharacterized protein n=1 Tax=Acinetobacter courvalinii TaxID=280147 RepID=N9NSS5_9GAMM|nr:MULTISPECIES: hypothetical protein [Acinetobacter]EXB27583.1 hypothetical protein J537_1076 [Acinetobacter baumannii 1437282]EXB46989.1 hypothetical protein J522_2557 [Acinetobacter baumannii 146457]RSN84263.1 hypothetical protein EA770_01505 [Acinetobacter baumannii]ENX05792.1 hypothetical protein F898_02736 [Acinetobacter courvalinii]ENX37013.1 hypothetical protein F888_02349 [Acinetobacter courvalinii]